MQEQQKNNIDQKHKALISKVETFDKTKVSISQNVFKGVYIFASFDLVNSTKIKYRDTNWLRLINELIDRSSSEWFGLKFWKFNGDELLYYAEVTAINQFAKILHQIYTKSNALKDKLLRTLSSDETLGFAGDLVGIKTAVWIAYVSDENDALNSRLNIDYIDFAGINMDEGFRMSKCAIQNKIVVDPKIAFLICLVADEIYSRKLSELDPQNRIKQFVNSDSLRNIDSVFAKFWYNNAPFDYEYEDLFKVVANNFRIVGYEKCKGVWEERPYPIIWYSDNWDSSIEDIKYDEMYNDRVVTKDLINNYYRDYEHSYLDTLKILRKIYDNVSVFRHVIKKILLECGFKLCVNDTMDKQYYALTYLYYTIVVINKKTNGVLAFLRSKQRGHLSNVWDFEQQKNAQTLDSRPTILQIQDRFKNNYGIDICVVQDYNRNSIIPMDIHPIYRKKRIHNGVLCFAYIDENQNLTEEEILDRIKSKLPSVISGYGYPFYSDVTFIHREDLTKDAETRLPAVLINNNTVTELTYAEILNDSETWNNHSKWKNNINKSTPNFSLTINDAIDYAEKGRE